VTAKKISAEDLLIARFLSEHEGYGESTHNGLLSLMAKLKW